MKVDLKFSDQIIGRYYLDFLIEDKIILELKTVDEIKGKNLKQVLDYLKAKKLKLGIIANFRTSSLKYKRILNSNINSK